ncbi:hypothetical protein PMAYCL1PPCAC_14494 [Pristionchus mayeri]|uniref:RBR-type E3 ubiquitin transferase n=1 Tax=Pristionchus mayeri TaxID=1317129 RepID=A0AAN5CH55_9BILA|nr:hypothetical protein PMAYCL1PPCAC_14494 [Pristionchus mayeri]
MNVPVTLRERRPDGQVRKRTLSVSVDESHDTVADVLQKLSSQCGIPDSRLQIVLGGCRLQAETSVQQLQLGPSTALLALVAETRDESIRAPAVDRVEQSGRRGFSSFFVYCKSCKGVNAAKLRVHCSKCDSTSVQVQREPERWSHVLRSHRIRAECYECADGEEKEGGGEEREGAGDGGAAVWARFVFKCATCSEPSAALQHLRLPYRAAAAAAAATVDAAATVSGSTAAAAACCICLLPLESDSTPPSPIVDLRCGHPLCLQCFAALVKSGLKSSQFSLHPLFGYTIGCPWPNCKALVKDPHHFALAGKENYSEYKSLAVEAFIASDAIKCPHCTIAFIWEAPEQPDQPPRPPHPRPLYAIALAVSQKGVSSTPDEEEPRRPIACPHCAKQFCGVCRREPCTCEDEEAANRVLFEATTRACPRCEARTERTGGCAHMHCAACGADWCFVCVATWTEECQWNHWFA